jgi:uncharacterized membrane protein (UPF0127 family)
MLAVQIAAGILLGGPTSTVVGFPESGAEITAEIADSPKEREEGLMYVSDLPLNRGMLFVFPDEEYRSFWMKNTYIPLDIIFVDKNGDIINIEEAHPEPNTTEENLKSYRSDEPAKYVIETNSTFTERNNISTGDKVQIR